MVTQRPALLNSVDKVLILRAGRADAFGPPKDVLRRVPDPKALAPTQPLASGALPPSKSRKRTRQQAWQRNRRSSARERGEH